jgi:hypothetical protein
MFLKKQNRTANVRCWRSAESRFRHIGGGRGNSLGTHAPETIGTQVSSGCIRLTNARVNVGTKVIAQPMNRRADTADGKRG